MMKRGKKGQVTLFVIIGIILLVSVGFYFYVQRETTSIIDKEDLGTIKEVGENLMPLKNYVEGCLQEVGTKGLRKLGKNGGYLYPEDEPSFIYNQMETVQENTFIQFYGDHYIPYWSLSVEPIDNLMFYQDLKIPSIEYIELQESFYIEENIRECIGYFQDFDERGTDIEIQGQPKVTSVITDGNVLVRMDLPIVVGELNEEVSEYYTEIEIPFKKYYDTGAKLVYLHQRIPFIENMIMLMISNYGNVDASYLPPLFAITEGYDYVTWAQELVKLQLKEMMQSYIQIFRIVGSRNSLELNLDGLEEAERKMFTNAQLYLMDIDETLLNSEISFIHLPNFPIYTKVHGKQTNDNLIKPYGTNLPLNGDKKEYTYQFYYDVALPVAVEMKFDLQEQDPFVLMFGIEGNIHKNMYWIKSVEDNDFIYWDDSIMQLEVEGASVSQNYDPETGEFYDAPEEPEKILFENAEQFVSGDLTIRVYDEKTLEELEEVVVSTGVGEYSAIKLGITHNNSDSEVKLISKAPLMSNGFIAFEKEGYVKKFKKLTTQVDQPQNIYVKLSPIQKKNVTMKVLDIELEWESEDLRIIGETTTNLRDIKDNESVSLTFTRINEGNEEYMEFTRFISLDNTTNSTTLELIPGKYSVFGTLIDNTGVVVPAKCKRVVEEPHWYGDEYKWIPEDPIELKPAMWGGLEFDEENPLFFPLQNVYENNTIELTAIKYPLPDAMRCLDSLNVMGEGKAYTMRFRTELLPRYLTNTTN